MSVIPKEKKKYIEGKGRYWSEINELRKYEEKKKEKIEVRYMTWKNENKNKKEKKIWSEINELRKYKKEKKKKTEVRYIKQEILKDWLLCIYVFNFEEKKRDKNNGGKKLKKKSKQKSK